MNAARRFAHVLLVIARRFQVDDGLVRAAALAYTSLLSLVPLLAVMFAILKGLGTQRRLEPLLLSRLSLTPETTETIIGYIDRTNVRTLGTLGAAALLLTVVSVLGTIESSFNHIWRVRQGRGVWRKVADYLSVVLLTPFLLLAAVAVTSSLQVRQVIEWVRTIDYLSQAFVVVLGLLPVAMNAAAIAVLYTVMPNRRPTPRAVLTGAAVAGLAWHLVQLAYVRFQIGMANYNAIYGALSQVPVTMAWLYVSWIVVLVGAEIAAVVEFGSDRPGADNSPPWTTGGALQLLVRAARAFTGGTRGVAARGGGPPQRRAPPPRPARAGRGAGGAGPPRRPQRALRPQPDEFRRAAAQPPGPRAVGGAPQHPRPVPQLGELEGLPGLLAGIAAQVGEELAVALGVDPVRPVEPVMEAAGARGHPDLVQGPLQVHDDLAAVAEGDRHHPADALVVDVGLGLVVDAIA